MNVTKEMLIIDDLMLNLADKLKQPGIDNGEKDALLTAIHELREVKLSLKIVNNY